MCITPEGQSTRVDQTLSDLQEKTKVIACTSAGDFPVCFHHLLLFLLRKLQHPALFDFCLLFLTPSPINELAAIHVIFYFPKLKKSYFFIQLNEYGRNSRIFSSQAQSAQVLEGSDSKPSGPIHCDTAIKKEFVGKII